MLKKDKHGYYVIDSLAKLTEWQKIISEESEKSPTVKKTSKIKKKSQQIRDLKYRKNNNYENND